MRLIREVADSVVGSTECIEWQDYECRNVLRALLENKETEKLISPVLMRVIFDYIGSMTDRIAYEEYKELYE